MRLYDLTERIHALLSDCDSDDNREELQRELEETYENLTQKLEAYAAVVRQLEADEAALKAEKERFDKRLKSVRSHKERMKYHMVTALHLVEPDVKGKRRIVGEQFNLLLAKNPLGIDADSCDLRQLPVEFVDYIPKIKARDLLTHIKETGDLPPGTALKDEAWSVRIK